MEGDLFPQSIVVLVLGSSVAQDLGGCWPITNHSRVQSMVLEPGVAYATGSCEKIAEASAFLPA